MVLDNPLERVEDWDSQRACHLQASLHVEQLCQALKEEQQNAEGKESHSLTKVGQIRANQTPRGVKGNSA